MDLENKVNLLNRQWTDVYYSLHYVHKDTITHQVIRLLQHIEKNKNPTIGDLARLLEINHNTASEHTKRLIQKGLVTKQRSDQDERKVYVILTEEGKHVLQRHTELDKEKFKVVLENLSKSDMEMIEQAFLILSRESKKCLQS